jgi:hypothetical protein
VDRFIREELSCSTLLSRVKHHVEANHPPQSPRSDLPALFSFGIRDGIEVTERSKHDLADGEWRQRLKWDVDYLKIDAVSQYYDRNFGATSSPGSISRARAEPQEKMLSAFSNL